MKSERNCSVFGCSNSYAKVDGIKPLKLYSFPTGSVFKPWTLERRKAWINFVKRKSTNGGEWQPTKNSRICSEHFLNGIKSEDPRSPSYNPSIHPASTNQNLHISALGRYQRMRKRESLQNDRLGNSTQSHLQDSLPPLPHCEVAFPDFVRKEEVTIQTDQDMNLPVELSRLECEFNGVDAGTLVVHTKVPDQTLVDSICGPNQKTAYFGGMSSVVSSDSVQEMTGVTRSVFAVLLAAFPNYTARINELDIENKLLLSLMKLKSGLPLSTIATIFGIHRDTAANIFNMVLRQLYNTTKDWIIFPSKYAVRRTMPSSFQTDYPSCRVIIDCTEFKTETPPTVEQKVQMYSSYKSGYTSKYLIGIAPSGLISYVSKGYGGRATDSFITNDCGLLDLLENGDTVMADKGFPSVTVQNGVTLIMPPFASRNEMQFSSTQMEDTYKIASVRIHVERAIARLKIFNILSHRIPVDLLPKLDMIVHMCAVLVNLGSPLIKSK